jgi:DNA replication protein DnaC
VKSFDLNLDAMCKRLSLANTRRSWRDLVARAESEQWSYHDFLSTVIAEEVAHRVQTRIQRNSQRSRFPFLKTVDDFDFTYQSTVKLSLLGSALSPDFVTDGRNLILHGKPGRGKTHLAVAIGYRAIQNGFDALFVTAAELIEDLSVASRDNELADALVRYVSPHVLIIDEVGYLTYSHDAANVLYHVVTQRHQAHRSMVFTSNKHPDGWGKVLHDDDLAAAIVDRVLERGRLLQLDGPSMRTKHLGLDAPAHAAAGSPPVARISGIESPEFPEPTLRSLADRGRGARRSCDAEASSAIGCSAVALDEVRARRRRDDALAARAGVALSLRPSWGSSALATTGAVARRRRTLRPRHGWPW